MNYYKQFAEMLGLELEQEFALTDADGNRKNELTYKITEYGPLCRSLIVNDWVTVSLITLKKIMDGDYKVVTKPWKPKKGEEFWRWNVENQMAIIRHWCNSGMDLAYWEVGNCFETKEEAETKGKEIMEQLQKEYEEA